MRISSALLSLLLLLLLVSDEFAPVVAVRGAHAARIPEHTCHKELEMKKCVLQKCKQQCSKQPMGVGQCRDTICSCTYYCKDPPL